MNNFQSNAKEFFLRTIRLYTNNFPIEKGKHRLYLLGLKMCGQLPSDLEIETKDERRFSVNLSTGMQNTVFFLGEYEKAITNLILPLLREGDVCLDIGANFGWYTTLFQKKCGQSGEVHSFEPLLPTFKELKRNYELMGKPTNVHINNLALGDKFDELKIYLFPHMATGHASLSTHDEESFIEYQCEMITLDSYLNDNDIADVNFVKIDIEGAEMMCLKGAEKLFNQEVPPIWLMEMALKATESFDYYPDDLLKFMNDRSDYSFYRIDEINKRLIKINEIEKDDIGANVICIPEKHYRERFDQLESFIS